MDIFPQASQNDSFLLFLIISVGGLIAVALCLVLYIVYLHRRHALSLKIRQSKHDLWRPRLFEYLEDNNALRSLREKVQPEDYELFIEFILVYADSIKGEDLESLKLIFKQFGLIDKEREYLRDSLYAWRRALAAYRLGQIGAVDARKDLVRALEDKQDMVVYNAAGSLMKLSDQESLPKVLALLLKNDVLTEELFAEIMLSYGKSITGELSNILEIYDELPDSRLKVIDYLGSFKGIEAIPTLIKLLRKSKEQEETVHLIKAIGNLAPAEIFEVLGEYLKSDNPLIRSQTAKALGNLKDLSIVHALLPLLEDSDWWCRFHSAFSILRIGEEGRNILMSHREKVKDRYAQDIINQVLSGSYGPY